MRKKRRADILKQLHAKAALGKPIFGIAADAEGATEYSLLMPPDFLVLDSTLGGHLAERGPLSGLLAFGDANGITLKMGDEVLPSLKKAPVFAGICGSDPFRVMRMLLEELDEMGFAGVQNMPSVGIIDGTFRTNLEETGIGFSREVEMIAEAHECGLLTCPCVFDAGQASAMTAAGADMIVAHMGLVAEDDDTEECVARLRGIVNAVHRAAGTSLPLILCRGNALDASNLAALPHETLGTQGYLFACRHLPVETERMPAEMARIQAVIERTR